MVFIRRAGVTTATTTTTTSVITSSKLNAESKILSFFNFFLSTQSALSLCQANSYNFCFLGVNSESEAKLSPKRRYRLVLGAQKEL